MTIRVQQWRTVPSPLTQHNPAAFGSQKSESESLVPEYMFCPFSLFTATTPPPLPDTTNNPTTTSTMALHYSPLPPSPSPPPHLPLPLSKRDIRRGRILERLTSMIDTFHTNQQPHYRAQLQAVQVDMTLVLRADPYSDAPLEEGSEELRTMVESMMGPTVASGDEGAERDYMALAGRRYREFVREGNDALERRDAELTALHVRVHYPILIRSVLQLTHVTTRTRTRPPSPPSTRKPRSFSTKQARNTAP